MRPSGRNPDQLRAVSFERGFTRHAEGSCLVRFGDTHVLCTASLEERVPPWLKGGDRVRIEMRDAEGRSIFGAIDQQVRALLDERAAKAPE